MQRWTWNQLWQIHDDVIKWKHFPHNWPFVRGIHRSPVNSPHKGQWRGAFMFPLICVWINGWVDNSEAGDLRCHRGHYDVNVMCHIYSKSNMPEESKLWGTRWCYLFSAPVWDAGPSENFPPRYSVERPWIAFPCNFSKGYWCHISRTSVSIELTKQ